MRQGGESDGQQVPADRMPLVELDRVRVGDLVPVGERVVVEALGFVEVTVVEVRVKIGISVGIGGRGRREWPVPGGRLAGGGSGRGNRAAELHRTPVPYRRYPVEHSRPRPVEVRVRPRHDQHRPRRPVDRVHRKPRRVPPDQHPVRRLRPPEQPAQRYEQVPGPPQQRGAEPAEAHREPEQATGVVRLLDRLGQAVVVGVQPDPAADRVPGGVGGVGGDGPAGVQPDVDLHAVDVLDDLAADDRRGGLLGVDVGLPVRPPDTDGDRGDEQDRPADPGVAAQRRQGGRARRYSHHRRLFGLVVLGARQGQAQCHVPDHQRAGPPGRGTGRVQRHPGQPHGGRGERGQRTGAGVDEHPEPGGGQQPEQHRREHVRPARARLGTDLAGRTGGGRREDRERQDRRQPRQLPRHRAAGHDRVPRGERTRVRGGQVGGHVRRPGRSGGTRRQ